MGKIAKSFTVSFSHFGDVSLILFYGGLAVRVVSTLRSWLLWASAGHVREGHWVGYRAF